MSRYVVIPRIRVQSANMHTNGFLLGGAPLMAASMFAHHLARQLGTQDQGMVYIHHDLQRLGGQAYGRFTPAQRRGAVFIGKNDYSSKNKYALSLQPTASCHLEFSLVIKLKSNSIQIEKLTGILQRSRFAGGQIIAFGKIETCDEYELDKALEIVKTGFVLRDRQDLLIQYQQRQQLNRLEAFTQLLALKTNALQNFFDDPTLSWLSATNLGYALLEAPTDERSGIRQADQQATTQHAYAEPLTGIVQYFSLNEALTNKAEVDDPIMHDLEQLVWRYHWPQDDIFLLQQQRAALD